MRAWFFGGLAFGLVVSLTALTVGAGAASPEQVTIQSHELFPVGGQTITFVATGGVFGTGVSGTATSTNNAQGMGSPTSGGHRAAFVQHGEDVYTTPDGTFTLTFRGHCFGNTCPGTWHITGGTGAYTGAQGGGTFLDLCTDDGAGGFICDDTITGKIQLR